MLARMSSERRLAIGSAILTLLGIAVPILWPKARWFGWGCLLVALVLVCVWFWAEAKRVVSDAFGTYPPLPMIAACLLFTGIAVGVLRLSAAPQTVIVSVTLTSWGTEPPSTAWGIIDAHELVPYQSQFLLLLAVRAQDDTTDWRNDEQVAISQSFHIMPMVRIEIPLTQEFMEHFRKVGRVGDNSMAYIICVVPAISRQSQIHVLADIPRLGGFVAQAGHMTGLPVIER